MGEFARGGGHGHDAAGTEAAAARDARRRPGRDVRGGAAAPRLGRHRQRGARPRAGLRRVPVEPGRDPRRGGGRAGQRAARGGRDAAAPRGGRAAPGRRDPEADRGHLGGEGFARRADRQPREGAVRGGEDREAEDGVEGDGGRARAPEGHPGGREGPGDQANAVGPAGLSRRAPGRARRAGAISARRCRC